ncbi:MAG TPA: ABC-ATPase domain-containing protein [Firmicutes bacterium]|nr:ABC-ATPase domain-containing protein [Bacillota bacterium]
MEVGRTLATAEDLRSTLRRIDGRGYKAYIDIKGSYRFPGFLLHIDRVQGDPFASPSEVRVVVSPELARFPVDIYRDPARRRGLEDFLLRGLAAALRREAKGHRGTGSSGVLGVMPCGQEILVRSALYVGDGGVEARLVVGLPAAGRTVLGREAEAVLLGELPRAVAVALYWERIDQQGAWRWAYLAEDQEHLRRQLPERGLVAFVANGSILPRESGVSDRPLRAGKVVPFQSPPSLEVEFALPHAGSVRGMGIPRGVTLIVGGGYHGKSTLLRALERGVYGHIPGDGRELVVTVPAAMKIRAEDGRRVEKVDISPFISYLPFGQDTRQFSSESASGSTSQAANIVEALEAGADVLLLDEDTSATNFMIRDARMQALVAKDREPITPFLDRVRSLWEQMGVSTVLVMGGSGDYFDVADTVIMMDAYRPFDVTAEARRVATDFPTRRQQEAAVPFAGVRDRVPLGQSLDPTRGPAGKVKIAARGTEHIRFGREDIVLDCVEQLVDEGQVRFIGDALYWMARHCLDGCHTLREALTVLFTEIEKRGLELVAPPGPPPGDYALARPLEMAAALNRLRTLRARPAGPGEEGGDRRQNEQA